MEKMKKMTIDPFDHDPVEVDPICGIESEFIRMKLKNGSDFDGRPIPLHIPRYTLVLALHYCKKRGKIKLHHLSHALSYDDENLTAQQKQLKDFDSEFLQYILRYPDSTLLLDICYAALKLRVKSLYGLVIDDVVRICGQLTPKQLHKTFYVAYRYPREERRSFSWAFSINDTHENNVELETTN